MTIIAPSKTLADRPHGARASARLEPWLAEAGALMRLSLPLIATQLAHMAMPTTDIFMIGTLGQDALAVAALATTIYIFALLIGLGPASAIAPIIAHIVGANPSDRARARIALRMGLWAMVVLTAPLCFSLMFAEYALLALGQTAKMAAAAAPYVQILAIGLPFALGFNVLRNFSTALGNARAPLIIMSAAVILNIILDYGLIFGRLGMAEFGLTGAAIATAICDAFCFFALAALLTFAPAFRSYRIWRRFHRADWRRFGETFRLGASIGVTMIFETALFAGSTLAMGFFGTAALAAHHIAMNVPSISFMVPLGIAMAASVRVGYAAGAGDPEGARRAGLTALMMGGGFMCLCALLLALLPRAIIGLYLDLRDPANEYAIAYAVSFLYVVAALQIFDGIQVVAAFSLRGLKDVRMPILIAGVSYWGAGLPLALLLGFVIGWEGVGIWIGLAAALMIAAALLSARFFYLSAPKIRSTQ
nr:MAG: MATE family efflux transporter [Hyphomicrobiales bacterium]